MTQPPGATRVTRLTTAAQAGAPAAHIIPRSACFQLLDIRRRRRVGQTRYALGRVVDDDLHVYVVLVESRENFDPRTQQDTTSDDGGSSQAEFSEYDEVGNLINTAADQAPKQSPMDVMPHHRLQH